MIRMNAGTGVSDSQSRRPHRATAIDAGHVERARAPPRAQPGVRGRHAESRLHASATRRIPDRRRRRRQRDGHRRAQGPGRSVRRRRGVCDRFAAAVSLHRAPACATTSISTRRASTNSIAGRAIATAATTTRPPRAMCRRTWSAIRTSMRTARGATTRPTATSGSRIAWPPAGRLTATATGHGSTPGAGRGSTTRRGASPSPTTVAGPTCAARGAGCPVPCARGPTTRRRWSRSSAATTSSSRSPAATSVAVAWFPLGPREVYRPSYAVSRGYFENVNRSNTVINTTVINNYYNNTNVTNVVYANRQVPGAVVAVPTTAFVQSQPVQRAAVRVSPEMVASAPVAVGRGRCADREKRARRRRPRRQAAAARVRAAVVARTAPPAATAGFAAQQQQLAAKPGKPLDDAARREMKTAAPVAVPTLKVVTPTQIAPPTARPPAATRTARPADTPGKADERKAPEVASPTAAAPAAPAAQPPGTRGRPAQPGNAEQRGQPVPPPVVASPQVAPPVVASPSQGAPVAQPAGNARTASTARQRGPTRTACPAASGGIAAGRHRRRRPLRPHNLRERADGQRSPAMWTNAHNLHRQLSHRRRRSRSLRKHAEGRRSRAMRNNVDNLSRRQRWHRRPRSRRLSWPPRLRKHVEGRRSLAMRNDADSLSRRLHRRHRHRNGRSSHWR